MDKNKCPIFIFKKKFQKIFFKIFCVFILRYYLTNTKQLAYNTNVTKSDAEHKEKLEKTRFFGHFSIFFGFFTISKK